MKDLCWLSATSLQRLFTSNELSPSDYIESILHNIELYDPKLHVFINLDPNTVRRQASIASKEVRSGVTRSPLHGIPVAIKDNIDVTGVPTTCQSKALLRNVASKDAQVVAKLREAGAIILGKVDTWEFAIGGPASDLPFPPANNPWKIGRQPGGSSSGSGAGLAAGFFPLALGTDTGGSVRHPAAACGVVGLKPTYGLVSREGVFPLSYTLDHVGPMARSVGDIGILLDVIARNQNGPHETPESYCRDLTKGVAGLRVGYVRNFHETDILADCEVAKALDTAASIFKSCGATVSDVELPPLGDFATVNRVILYSEAWSVHRKSLCSRPQDYGKLSRRRITSGAFLSAEQYIRAQRQRNQLISIMNQHFHKFDVLLSANSMDPAGSFDEFTVGSPVNFRQARTPFNVTGHPAISLMSGLSKEGLPLSLQLIGRFYDEATLLRAAAAYENAIAFGETHPSLKEQWI